MKLLGITRDHVLEISREFNERNPEGQTHTFIVDESIFSFAIKTAYAERDGVVSWEELPTPVDAKRHGQLTIIALPNKNGMYHLIGIDEEQGKPAGYEKNIVFFMSDDETTTSGVGYFFPGGHVHIFREYAEKNEVDANEMCNIMMISSFVLSLINQPRMVSTSSALSRQQRRMIERKHGSASSKNMSVVKWDVSKSSASAHSERSGGVDGKALHWRRGHWRRAEKDWKGARQRLDALRPEERDLWWQWIEGMWVGHPAYGFVQSVHAPKMSATEMFKRGSK